MGSGSEGDASQLRLAQQLLSVVDTAPEAVLALDRDWTYVYANAAAVAMLKLDSSPVGQDSRLLHPDAEASPFGAAYRRVMAGGPEEVAEHHYEPLDTYLRARVLPWPDGIVVILSDVTAQRRPEHRLVRDFATYRALLDHSRSSMSLRDLDSRFVLINQAGAELIGRPVPEIVGRVPHELFDQETAEQLRAADLEAQRSRDILDLDAISAYQQRHGRRVLSQIFPVHGSDGDLLGTGTVTTDVTRLARAEAELAASQRRFRDVFASTSLGILLTEEFGRIVEANAAVCRLLGYSRSQLLSMRGEQLLPRVGVDAARRRHQLESGPFGYETEAQLIRSDGVAIPALLTVNGLDDPEGGGQLVSVVIRDLTALRGLEEQLVRGERMEAVGRLAAGVVHDANNVLAAVSGYAEMLAEEIKDRPSAQRHLAGIHRSVQRAADMVRQLLAFTRGQELTLTPVCLQEVVRDLEDMLRRLLPTVVDLQVETAPAPTRADASQVRQVLINLVVNARDAISAAGRITVRTDHVSVIRDAVLPDGHYALLSVTDDGQGMEERVAGRCFEPFFSTRVGEGGNGLGLSTAHGIARQSGGDLRVSSTLGVGSTFELLLPLLSQESPDSAVACPVALVAEDDALVRAVIAEMLTSHGFTVVQATDGAHALDASVGCDLLVTDVSMPNVGGLELIDRLRTTRPELPVVLLSGAARPEDAPPAEFLPKPFRRSDLLAAVDRAMGRRP